MATVALSTFVEFSVAQGTARVAAVADSKAPYDPARDFYKRLREKTIQQFVSGWNSREFAQTVREVATPRKAASFDACRRGISSWARKKAITGSKAATQSWSAAGLDVKVNPELRLVVNGSKYNVKLYFKGMNYQRPGRNTSCSSSARPHPKESRLPFSMPVEGSSSRRVVLSTLTSMRCLPQSRRLSWPSTSQHADRVQHVRAAAGLSGRCLSRSREKPHISRLFAVSRKKQVSKTVARRDGCPLADRRPVAGTDHSARGDQLEASNPGRSGDTHPSIRVRLEP